MPDLRALLAAWQEARHHPDRERLGSRQNTARLDELEELLAAVVERLEDDAPAEPELDSVWQRLRVWNGDGLLLIEHRFHQGGGIVWGHPYERLQDVGRIEIDRVEAE